MDPRFFVSREELHEVQMDLRKVHSIQQHQSERLRLLEKRQADDAALKSVWNSPFPSVLGGTPLHVHNNELFNDLEEQGHNLLNSLHLEADDEPARKGAASRANSVRFDVSALHGSNWSAHGGRHSGEFTPIRPGSELGGHQMMERSLSHKSDGRHSSAGFSVHSAHSGVSGRASSLGLDTNFSIGGHDDEDDDSPIDAPEPPPGFYYLGSPPSIIRCWLTTSFTSSSLLYAVVCTGSQRTTVEYSLLKDLDLLNDVHRESDGVCRITLPVYLAEARVTHSKSRSTSPAPQLPSLTASFEVTGMDQEENTESKKGIRVVIGCETLRRHSADLLLSQNSMTLYGNDRDKLSVPFVRPEDDSVFKYLTTANFVPGKQKLNAAAPEFVSSDTSGKASASGRKETTLTEPKPIENGSGEVLSPRSQLSQLSQLSQPVRTPPTATAATSESGAEAEKQTPAAPSIPETSGKENSSAAAESSSHTREHNNAAIRTPWRQTAIGAGSGGENGPLSGYQPATRPRNMKVLRPNKSAGATSSSSTSARTGAAYEPAPPPRSSSEYRRRSQAAADSSSHPPSSSSSSSWGNSLASSKRSVSSAATMTTTGGGGVDGGRSQPLQLQAATTHSTTASTSGTSSPSVPRTANNPLGGATAFSWIAQPSKSSRSATAAD